MLSIPERFFFHNFPRLRSTADEQTRKGLLILRSLCRNGLLLVPERVSWTDPSGTRPGDPIVAMQRRMCFTELAEAELRPHANTFGPFALEYRIADLRQMGLLPVIYIPDSTSKEPALDWAGVSLLARLADAAQVIGCLAETQQIAGKNQQVGLLISGVRDSLTRNPA